MTNLKSLQQEAEMEFEKFGRLLSNTEEDKMVFVEGEIKAFLTTWLEKAYKARIEEEQKAIYKFQQIVNEYEVCKDGIDDDNKMLYGLIEEAQIFINIIKNKSQ